MKSNAAVPKWEKSHYSVTHFYDINISNFSRLQEKKVMVQNKKAKMMLFIHNDAKLKKNEDNKQECKVFLHGHSNNIRIIPLSYYFWN